MHLLQLTGQIWTSRGENTAEALMRGTMVSGVAVAVLLLLLAAANPASALRSPRPKAGKQNGEFSTSYLFRVSSAELRTRASS